MTVANTTKNNLQDHMVCEGTRTVTGFSVRWSNRWLAIGRGYSPADVIDQYINIAMPANGTVIPRSTGAAGATVDANGILLGSWETLYWRQNVNGGADSGSFIIVPYNDNYVGGENEVWVARRVGSQHIEWADRRRDNDEGVPNTDDFWRRATNPADVASDAQTPANATGVDYQQDIHHQGRLSIGAGQRFGGGGADESWRQPRALIDANRWNQLRTGTDRRNDEDVIYATGLIDAGPQADALPSTAWFTGAKSFIGHVNQTAGFVIGWNAIYQVGETSHDMVLGMAGSSAHFGVQWAGLAAGAQANTYWNRSTTPAGNTIGWQHLFTVGATALGNWAFRRSSVGAGDGYSHLWQARAHNGSYQNAMDLVPSPVTVAHRLDVNPALQADDALLVLYSPGGAGITTNKYALGIRNSTLAYFVSGQGAWHRFYAGEGRTIAESIVGFFEDTSGRSRVRFERGLPVFASNALAAAGGMAVGDMYRDATGVLHVRF